MRWARVTAVAKPYVAVAGTFVLAAVLLATISLTTFDRQWIVFLGGVLSAAILAFVSYNTNARWVIARRTSQLNNTRGKLVTEVRLRAHAEEALARIRTSVELVDRALPAMLVYVDNERRVRYHNHAYKRWIGLEEKAIDGRGIEDIVGRAAYAEIAPHLTQALQGRDVCYERTQTMADGHVCRLAVQYLPHYAEAGKVAGVFAILIDVTRAVDLGSAPPQAQQKAVDDDGARLIAALGRDEFSLFSQAIAPLGAKAAQGTYCEVLLRLDEEEENHLPPGSFLPLAEELGLLHEIDRWVVRNVLEFASTARSKHESVYFVNLSAPTIVDPTFAQFVRERIKASRVPDHTLCFELPESDVLSNLGAYREFIAALDGTGCRFAVSGFGCNPLALRLLKQLRIDFLKLDGGIALGMLNSPGGLAKVKAINLAAHAAGMRTIAQCVESDSTREALEAVDTDFAQGFGIAMPQPMGAPGDGDSLPEPDLQKAAA
jgi:PAS domain S-box-containing protein